MNATSSKSRSESPPDDELHPDSRTTQTLESAARAASSGGEPASSPPRDALNQGGFSSAGQRQVIAADKVRNDPKLPKLSDDG